MSPAAAPPWLAGVRVPRAQALPHPQGLHCPSQAPAGAITCRISCSPCSVPRQALPNRRTRLVALVLRVPWSTVPPHPAPAAVSTRSAARPQGVQPPGSPACPSSFMQPGPTAQMP